MQEWPRMQEWPGIIVQQQCKWFAMKNALGMLVYTFPFLLFKPFIVSFELLVQIPKYADTVW
jgi:hypothetical protein